MMATAYSPTGRRNGKIRVLWTQVPPLEGFWSTTGCRERVFNVMETG
jgi:hypothetical protein